MGESLDGVEAEREKMKADRREVENQILYPDERDAPMNQTVIERYKRYVALVDLEKGPWDLSAGLPDAYRRIFQFENFKGVQKRALRLASSRAMAAYSEFFRDCCILPGSSCCSRGDLSQSSYCSHAVPSGCACLMRVGFLDQATALVASFYPIHHPFLCFFDVHVSVSFKCFQSIYSVVLVHELAVFRGDRDRGR